MTIKLAATAFALTLAATSSLASAAERLTVPLTDGWRFTQDDTLTGAEAPGFDDKAWAAVSVPHTWNRAGYYLSDGPHLHTPATINAKQGVGWYRLAFTAPAAIKDKTAWLQFDAASRKASVWLNGVHLGDHAGGFSRFRLDASQPIRPGQPNLLVVRVDGSRPVAGGPTADILPLGGDFFVHGGLYRAVSLVATDKAHFDMLDFGGPGVYARTTAIGDGKATVAVRSKLRNDARRGVKLVLTTQLVDASGAVAAQVATPVTLAAGQSTEVAQDLALAAAHLWQGVKDPYLYRLKSVIKDARGQVVDSLDQGFGVRQIRIDSEKGLILNGQPLRLHGVGYHQDREGKGWAVSAADTAQDMAIIREMGANTIRLTHYQHGTAIHELADQYGLILWDEIPFVSVMTLAADQVEPTPGLVADARQQLQELIRQNYNHASVGVWGIANEVDLRGTPPSFMGAAKIVQRDPTPCSRTCRPWPRPKILTGPRPRPPAAKACSRTRPKWPRLPTPAALTAISAGTTRPRNCWARRSTPCARSVRTSRCRSASTAPAGRSASIPTIRWAARSTRSAASSPRNTRPSSTRRTGRSWTPGPISGRPGCGTASTSPPATVTRATARASTPRAW